MTISGAQPETFHAWHFFSSSSLKKKDIEQLIVSLYSNFDTDPERVSLFFTRILSDRKNEIVDFCCKRPELAELNPVPAILTAVSAGIEDWARITLARYVKYKAYGGKVEEFLDPARALIGEPESPVKLGYLVASIFMLRTPVEGRHNIPWNLRDMRGITKRSIDLAQERLRAPYVDWAEHLDFLAELVRAIYDMLTTDTSNPHLYLGLILGYGPLCGLDNVMLPALFGRSALLRKAFATRQDLLVFLAGYLAPE